MLLGGTHLGFLNHRQIEKTIAALKEFPIKHIGTSHCTGFEASNKLAHEFGKKFFFAHAGSVIEV
jgi:7,8-dihydropterin-6-yl-methyl-4-(beta-D-ribofuranosyl)aminobenzene 5'-phosphate synthase